MIKSSVDMASTVGPGEGVGMGLSNMPGLDAVAFGGERTMTGDCGINNCELPMSISTDATFTKDPVWKRKNS